MTRAAPYGSAAWRRWKHESHWDSSLPPADRSHLVWAWDPDAVTLASEARIGPAGTLSAPVRTPGRPAYYTFASTDVIDFGDSLDATWANAGGWTVYICATLGAGDLSGLLCMVSKAASGAAEWAFEINSAKLRAVAYYASTTANFDIWAQSSAALTAGRYVFALAYDPTQPRGSRLSFSTNGSSVPGGNTAGGTFGSITDTSSALQIGHGALGIAPVSILSYAYAFSAPHGASAIAVNSAWLRTVKGWR